MSQHDYNVANAPGSTVRADINALAEALASQNAGNSAPSVTFPFMLWSDTTNALLKIRNAANNAWITLGTFGASSFTLDAGLFSTALSSNWFGTVARVVRIETTGNTEIGGVLDFHPDAAGTEDYRFRLSRATGANGAATIENTGSGGLNVIPGSGGFKVDGIPVFTVPVGTVLEWSGTTLPAKCVWANGQNLNRTTYSALFAATGTTYGAGDGSTTFGVIDKRGRVGAGKDDMGGSAAGRLTNSATGGVQGATLGAAGGEQAHIITLAEMAAHTHSYSNNGNYGANGQTYSSTDFNAGSGDSNRGSYTLTTTSVGTDEAHNNVQPTIVVNYIVYTGV